MVCLTRRWFVFAALTCALSCAGSPAAPTQGIAPTGAAIRVLVLTATAGFRHDSIATARDVLPALGASNGFAITPTENLDAISASNLANFDVVMFANTSGELAFTAGQRSALLDFVGGGKGFVGTHSATDTLREWAEYGRLVGAYVIDHPWTQQARVIVEDGLHPAAGIRDAFSLEEEFYVFGENPRGRVQVLLRLDPVTVGSSGDYPLAWAHTFGSGRAYYNALGHFPATWRDPRFQAQLVAGIRWAAAK